MFDIGKILKRAWHILWNYKVLWIFGILLAITMGGTGGANGAGRNGGTGLQYQFNQQDWNWLRSQPGPLAHDFSTWAEQNLGPLFNHPEQHIGTFIAIGVGILLFILLIGAIIALVRYPSETAVLRMVNDYEQTGQKVSFGQGWKLGWTRRAFRIWVIDLIIGVPAFLLIALIVGVGFAIFFSVESHVEFVNVAGVIASAGGLVLFIFIFIVGMTFLGILRQFFVRKAALENTRIGESLRLGWQMFKQNWKNALLMWLVTAGLSIGMWILTFILFFLLIPTYVIMALPAALIAAVPGLIVFGITSLFGSVPLGLIIGGLFALPLFFTIVFLPLSLIGGWFKIYESSLWTLTYREMKASEVVKSEEAPAELQ